AVLEQVSNVPTGVYVSCTLYGSPASTALRPGVWITEVDGMAVADLDEFLNAVHHHEKKVVRSRQGSVCEFALKRLSLVGSSGGSSNKRLSAAVANHQHLMAHPEGLPAQHQHHMNQFSNKNSTDEVHPHDASQQAPMISGNSENTGIDAGTGAGSFGSSSPEGSESPTMDSSDDAAQSQGYVRIKIQARNGTVSVIAMKLDPIYWSTTQLLPDPESVSGWKMVDVL
ncbi:hypothetical protein BGX28_007994, partial [Mortierella sp. GBA30]